MGVGTPYEVITASFAHLDGAAQALAALERAERADLLDIENADIRSMAETMAPGTSLLVAIVHHERAGALVVLLGEQGTETASAELSPTEADLLTAAGRGMNKQE
jgi:hypothetical protein